MVAGAGKQERRAGRIMPARFFPKDSQMRVPHAAEAVDGVFALESFRPGHQLVHQHIQRSGSGIVGAPVVLAADFRVVFLVASSSGLPVGPTYGSAIRASGQLINKGRRLTFSKTLTTVMATFWMKTTR